MRRLVSFILTLCICLSSSLNIVYADTTVLTDEYYNTGRLTYSQVTELGDAIANNATLNSNPFSNYCIYTSCQASSDYFEPLILNGEVNSVTVVFYDSHTTSSKKITIGINGQLTQSLYGTYDFNSKEWSNVEYDDYTYDINCSTNYNYACSILYSTEVYTYNNVAFTDGYTELPTLAMSSATGDKTAAVYLEQEATNFSVSVPLCLPVALQSDGTITTASNASIINTGSSLIKVSAIEVTPAVDWEIFDYADNLKASDFGLNKVALQINGNDVTTAGTVKQTVEDFRDISIANPVTITYNAKIPAQAESVSDVTAATVVFTLAWDGYATSQVADIYEKAGITLDEYPYYALSKYNGNEERTLYVFSEEPLFYHNSKEDEKPYHNYNNVAYKEITVSTFNNYGLVVTDESVSKDSSGLYGNELSKADYINFNIYSQNTGILWTAANC